MVTVFYNRNRYNYLITYYFFNFFGENLAHSFRDSVSVCKLRACCWDMQNFRAKQAVLVLLFKVKGLYSNSKINKTF